MSGVKEFSFESHPESLPLRTKEDTKIALPAASAKPSAPWPRFRKTLSAFDLRTIGTEVGVAGRRPTHGRGLLMSHRPG